MLISIDGGVTWLQTDECRIHPELSDTDTSETITLTATKEGLVTDVWAGPPHEENIGTSSELWDDMIARLT